MYILGGVTIPDPKTFSRSFIEQAVERLVMFGKTVKKVENRKERFVLKYQYLTQAQVNSINSLYNLDQALSFQVTETNLAISETAVLMDIQGREYPMTGDIYRENMTVVLAEIQ